MEQRDGFMPGRENRLILTVYEDEAETQPEDLTGRKFSCTVFDPKDPDTAVSRLVGDASVIVTAPLTGVIELVFPPTAFNDVRIPAVQYVIDDVTVPATPKKFLPADEIPVSRAPSPTVPE